ncbi:protein phosphatase 2C domain-containing protein [Actinoplanes sp. NPDC051633]|uniref:PP2C family protein-serine/threonine phosphatase n=1 Tax=Actinoplanes sp. NPDC051633 TaxID=3155670 RepID=UPI003439DCC7
MADLAMTAGSVTGNRYPANFDKMRAEPQRRLAVVADGMGDGPGSDEAGNLAVEVFAAEAAPDASALRAAVAEIQRQVIAAGHARAGLTGCTLTGFVAGGDEAWIVQLGDSRAYRLRAGLLELLTTDHTIAWLGAVHGWFAHDSPEARTARYRLTRYAGHPDAPEPDLLNVALRAGDRLLLCTDGLTDQVPYERIQAVLEAGGAGAVDSLLADSLAAGGTDNATAVIVEVG